MVVVVVVGGLNLGGPDEHSALRHFNFNNNASLFYCPGQA